LAAQRIVYVFTGATVKALRDQPAIVGIMQSEFAATAHRAAGVPPAVALVLGVAELDGNASAFMAGFSGSRRDSGLAFPQNRRPGDAAHDEQASQPRRRSSSCCVERG